MQIRFWHRPLSLIIGVPTFWIILTGVCLSIGTFIRESKAPYRIPPELINQSPSLHELPSTRMFRLLDSATSNYPNEKIRSVELGDHAWESDRIRFASGTIAFYAPGKTEPFEILSGDENNLAVIARLHRGKFAGTPGRLVFSSIGGFSLLLALSGVFLMRRPLSPWKTWRSRQWHQFLSWFTVIPFLLLVVTGIFLNFTPELRPAKVFSPSLAENPDILSSWRDSLRFAESKYPLHKMTESYWVGDRFMMIFLDSTRIFVGIGNPSQFSIHPADSLTWGWLEKLEGWHSGRAWGQVGTGFVSLFSIFIAALALIGLKLIKLGPFKRESWKIDTSHQ